MQVLTLLCIFHDFWMPHMYDVCMLILWIMTARMLSYTQNSKCCSLTEVPTQGLNVNRSEQISTSKRSECMNIWCITFCFVIFTCKSYIWSVCEHDILLFCIFWCVVYCSGWPGNSLNNQHCWMSHAHNTELGPSQT